MKRFINDLKKYKNYIFYATKSELKTEVINSHLGFLWLILEPIAFMLIYVFIATIVFKSKLDYFPVFVFVGLTAWNFFNKMLMQSVKLVSSNRDTVTKVYLPKFVLLIIKLGINLFKMFVSLVLVAILMIVFKVPLSLNMLWFIPLLIGFVTITFGICLFVMHIGVFMEDLSNLMNIALKMLFYMTGVFYDISTRITDPVYRTLLLEFNPVANYAYNFRQVLIYQNGPMLFPALIWFLIGIILCILGIRTIYKYENTYVKVMK